MSAGVTFAFYLPQDWTLRKVTTAMVQEWLPPFRAEPNLKAARWVVQSVMEASDKGEAPLWEPGISTSEYESRLDRADLGWAIRATAGRGKGTILARFAVDKEKPRVLHVTCPQTTFPETLFDADKVEDFLREQGAAGADLFAAILTQHGFQRAE